MRFRCWSVPLLVMFASSAVAEIPNSYRAERWEGSFRVIGLEGQTVPGERGSSVDITDDVGFGFDMAYNRDEHLSFGFALEWIETDFRTDNDGVSGDDFDGRGELEMTTMNLNATWHFVNKALTPYVHGAVGATYLDTNVATGPSVPVCWYDPWWGYYCGLDTPTLSDTVFSYEAGAGLRLDMTDTAFMRAGYSRQWLDVDRGVGTLDQGLWRFGIGMMFN
ncbi:lipoprotein [Alcanivorax nanhaiticus]|uniref:Lipoprotein n=1 Tax=Alcanivorax nanhaiticus TaxID=1177154 RepID=A0A095SLN4_9GAMM|nr:outer membrane beta-barrel protein [Alcanivorax nanhaiticus]KGD65497.1 lipoprotein [Alcanivorax nanhaiticus]